MPEDNLNCVIGIGAQLWDRLFEAPRPAGLHDFIPLTGGRHSAPAISTFCFELAKVLIGRLGDRATVVDETHGFKYFDERDLLGFVDGTENPEGQAAVDAVLIGAEDPQYAGQSLRDPGYAPYAEVGVS